MEWDFRLLGPVGACRAGIPADIARGKQRVLLAALLLKANRTVPGDELIDALWGAEPPTSAQATLQNYVKRLRQALGDDSSVITWQDGGYQIRVQDGELDLARFEAMQDAAREAAGAGEWDKAAGLLRGALSLWRGEPLTDVQSDLLTLRDLPRLAELRLQALEALSEAGLRLGHGPAVIAELRRLTAEYPLRERLHALLMLALHGEGQQAEALAIYRDVRRLLVTELGTDPGPQLRRAHQEILGTGEAPGAKLLRSAASIVQVPSGRRRAAPAPVPRQLPAAVSHFSGRGAELAKLARMSGPERGFPEAVVISAIAGTAGVGKTALAVRWAHEVAGRFPDGQLYVNLRGYDPGPALAAGDALAGFLRALGVAGPDLPLDLAERAALYRSLLAGRRMLVILDNARYAGQVRPLLPGGPGCAVVVTSRDSLAGLVSREGAQRLELRVLSAAESAALLRALIGGRADEEPGAVEALAAACAGLPLALRIAAEMVTARPKVQLSCLAAELADQARLLDADGDTDTALRCEFSWSFRHLDAAASRMFRRLVLHPGTDFEPQAAAALTTSASKGQMRCWPCLRLPTSSSRAGRACPGCRLSCVPTAPPTARTCFVRPDPHDLLPFRR